jgi:phospholipid transport system substrate-binding protein
MDRQKQQFLRLLVLCWLPLSVISLRVQGEPGPDTLLREVTDNVLAEIRKDPEQLKDIARVRALTERFILPHGDFQAAAQWVLGKYWRTASGAQRVRFVDEFRQLLLNTYVRSISNYRDNRISIAPARGDQASGRTEVDAEIERPGGPPVHLGFRLHRRGDDWLVYDISVEGISLVATHRSSFSKVIHDQGLDSLIDDLVSLNARNAGDGGGEAAAAMSAP